MRERLCLACANPRANLVCGLAAGLVSIALMVGAYNLGRERPRNSARVTHAITTPAPVQRTSYLLHQCAGVTRSGNTCRRMLRGGPGYCYQHQGQERQ